MKYRCTGDGLSRRHDAHARPLLGPSGPPSWEQFAQAHDFDNGYGGFAHRQWGWLSWTDGLADALRASMASSPDGVLAPIPEPEAVVANIKPGLGGHLINKNQWFAVAAFAGLAVSAPIPNRAWHE